jgi:hypothetical protein
VTVAIRTGAPSQPPSWALRSRLLYLLELVLATVAALYTLLTVAIHTVLRGTVPTTISRAGFTWAQGVTKTADEKVASFQEQLNSFGAELTALAEEIAPGRGKRS